MVRSACRSAGSAIPLASTGTAPALLETAFTVAGGPSGESKRMTIGTSMFLIAVGAIHKYAVTAGLAGIGLQTTGLILMLVGVLGLVLGLCLWNSGRTQGGAPPPAV